jgi:hypothetical protein
MAASIATLTVTATDRSVSTLRVFGTILIGAGTYAAGGVPFSFAGLDAIKSSSAPKYVEFRSNKSPTNGWQYQWNPGATPSLTSGKIQAFGQNSTTGPLVEMANGTTDAGMTGDVIQFEAGFNFGV